MLRSRRAGTFSRGPLNASVRCPVPSSYSCKGIQFTIPDDWKVVEDDLDEVIRAITIDASPGGYCMIDLYRSDQAPSLDGYIEGQLVHYKKALPGRLRMVGEPLKAPEQTVRRGQDIEGVRVRLDIRGILARHPDLNSFFRIELGEHTGMFSLRCPEGEFETLRPKFHALIETFESRRSQVS